MKKLTSLIAIAAFGLSASFFAFAANDKCPISGEPVDSAVSLSVNGKDIGFCCNNCKKKYEKKLNVTDAGPEKCPMSGEAATADTRILHAKSEVKYFCCEKCQAKFIKEAKLEVKDAGPGKCPISGKAASADHSLVVNGETTYFCCENCPKGFLKKIAAVDKGPSECPVSGEPAKAGQKIVFTKTAAVYFCCNNCQGKFIEKTFAKN